MCFEASSLFLKIPVASITTSIESSQLRESKSLSCVTLIFLLPINNVPLSYDTGSGYVPYTVSYLNKKDKTSPLAGR